MFNRQIKQFAIGLRRFRRDQSGVSAVEFSLIFPVFMTIMFASIDLGVLMMNMNRIQSSSNVATRFLSLGSLKAADAPSFFREATKIDGLVVKSTCKTIEGQKYAELTVTSKPAKLMVTGLNTPLFKNDVVVRSMFLVDADQAPDACTVA